MRRQWTFVLALFLAGTLHAQDRGMGVRAAQEAGLTTYDPARMHALVIGINKYQNWRSLRSAVSDARAVANVLRHNYGYGNVSVLLNEQASRENMLKALDGYMKLGEADSLLIYYAGHGYMDDYGNGFWVPPEAPRDNKFAYLPNSQIVNDFFKKYRVKHLLVVADSCFSGTLLRGGEGKREKDWKLPAGFEKPSRLVLTSGDLAPVADDAGGGHSPFAERFLQYLKAGDLEAFGIQDLYVWLRRYMGKQEPLFQALDTPKHMPGGEYVFCRVVKGAPAGPIAMARQRVVTAPPMEDGPVRQVRTGTLVVKSAEQGTVRVGTKAPDGIEPSESLRWERLAVGKYPVTVTAGDGVTWTGQADVREGQVCELEAVFIPVEGQNWIPASVGMEFVWISALKLWAGKYEVTNEEYRKKVSGHASKSCENRSLNGDRQPVVYVNFDDGKAYAKWLTQQERDAGRLPAGYRYRLPSEAEWQALAQCGDGREYPWGNAMPPKYGNYADLAMSWAFSGGTIILNYNDGYEVTCPVEKSGENDWGLYGMGGNVWEMAASDSSGVAFGAWRGAAWDYAATSDGLRCAFRCENLDTSRRIDFGFRLVLGR